MTMAAYTIPEVLVPKAAAKDEVVLIASGDLRQSANQVCWPAQAEVEAAVTKAFAAEGWKVRRAHAYREDLKHGFIYNQRMGMDVFAGIDPEAPVVVVEAVWQYSAPYSGRAGESSRADSDGGELVGAVAGVGGDAEFEWQPGQGGGEVLDDMEQGLQRCVLCEWAEAVDQGRQDRSRYKPGAGAGFIETGWHLRGSLAKLWRRS
jgi:hypothetical protein